MFTGLIEDLGAVKQISDSQIAIETKLNEISTGDSICVNGACLTAVLIKSGIVTFDYSAQTDKITTLSTLKPGQKVNLERALQLSSRLGGHIVSGHVDGKAKIAAIEKQERFYKLTVSLNDECLKFCVDKGSIAVDGISLTIATITGINIELFIIPETFKNTALQYKKSGDYVNIETDILAKYIEKFTNKKTGSSESAGRSKESALLELLKEF